APEVAVKAAVLFLTQRHYLQRLLGLGPPLAQQPQSGKGAEDAKRAVVSTPEHHGVNVRPGQNRARTLTFDTSKEVADGVAADLQSRLAHPVGDPLARGDPRGVVDVANDAATRLFSDRAELLHEARHFGWLD